MLTKSICVNPPVAATEFLRVVRAEPWTIALKGDDGGTYHVRFSEKGQQQGDSADAWIAAGLARGAGLQVAPHQTLVIPNRIQREVILSSAGLPQGINLLESEIYLADRIVGPDAGPLRPFSFLPHAYIKHLGNKEDLLGMYLFDIWVERDGPRRILFRRTGHNQDIRATFVNDGKVFTDSKWDLRAGASCMCIQALSLYSGRNSTKATQRWLRAFSRTFPAAFDLAVSSLPVAWRRPDEEPLRARLVKRLGTLPILLAEIPLFQAGLASESTDIRRKIERQLSSFA